MGTRNITKIILLLFIVIIIIGCANSDSYYIVGNKEQKQELKKLFELLHQEDQKHENRFIVMQRIIKIFHNTDQDEKLNLFLTTYVENHPKDTFNAYYLMVVAQNYMEQEAYPFAVHYFERILKNYPDLSVQDQSLHYICLKHLIQLVDKPQVKVGYYKDLLSRFSDEVDKGKTYYYLAKTYEELGEWDLAVQAYNNYLKYPDTTIPGEPDARHEIETMVEYYTYDGEDWTMESLDELVKTIKWAIYRRDVRTLRKYMSKINFFTTSWEEQKTHLGNDFKYHLSAFLNSRIHYAAELDKDSNAQEAYLRTTGWSYRIRTWYLYFRKVYFPADPERHGRWEWAGIYFGEKPFVGSNENL
jgi:tetratricopeptide (TPR) repeat protein